MHGAPGAALPVGHVGAPHFNPHGLALVTAVFTLAAIGEVLVIERRLRVGAAAATDLKPRGGNPGRNARPAGVAVVIAGLVLVCQGRASPFRMHGAPGAALPVGHVGAPHFNPHGLALVTAVLTLAA